MRNTTIKGLTDEFCDDLGSSVDYVAKVIEIGVCVDYLIYEVRLSGKELKEFYSSIGLSNKPSIINIKDENEYIIRAYDW
ncbi:MAG: hypothetical protein IJW43_01595 [Clostridia bacterium]|nr:hypothetical protein [Clostridia bacterium]